MLGPPQQPRWEQQGCTGRLQALPAILSSGRARLSRCARVQFFSAAETRANFNETQVWVCRSVSPDASERTGSASVAGAEAACLQAIWPFTEVQCTPCSTARGYAYARST